MALQHLYRDGGRGSTESLRIVQGMYLAGLGYCLSYIT